MTLSTTTVLLVHGAFADGSSWSRVIARLQAEGVDVRAVANPLRGLTFDGEYVANAIAQTEGDVVLVGHSYGGAVATYAGSKAANVKAFVLVGAFGLDEGESAQSATAAYPDPELLTALQPWTYPGSEIPEFTIQADKYPHVFGADLPEGEGELGALNQRPVSGLALGEPLAVTPTWRNVPTWWVFGSADNAINPDFQRDTAKKIGATAVELEGGSHAIAASRSEEVTAVILDAVRSI